MFIPVNHSDLGAGLILAGSAAVFLFLARNLEHGSALAMGPGYFPRYVAGMGLLIGAILVVRAVRNAGQVMPAFRLRPLAFMLGSVVFFGQFVHVIGLAATAFCTIVIAGLADRQGRPLQIVATATIVTFAVCIVFVRLLGVPLPLWPAR